MTHIRYQHPSGLNPEIVKKVMKRRGRLHAFEQINPKKTALVVIDLTIALVKEDENCKRLIHPVNKLADTLRQTGGRVAWVSQAPNSNGPHMTAIVGGQTANHFKSGADQENISSKLWPDLDVKPEDISTKKQGFSAFFPGKCDLPDTLKAHDIDTVLIAGTVTNICCESSARDACEHGFKVIMVSDCNVGHARGIHDASLNNFYRIFGDVRPSAEIAQLLEKHNKT